VTDGRCQNIYRAAYSRPEVPYFHCSLCMSYSVTFCI